MSPELQPCSADKIHKRLINGTPPSSSVLVCVVLLLVEGLPCPGVFSTYLHKVTSLPFSYVWKEEKEEKGLERRKRSK